ncbi:hypothetical protein BC939DRAFT_498184 [Gamsiella multidivaricata]|uniref:uncharacterized protein n=1 Tax=Gamsiella multidivaricata TaxID=101098 RepID=UPI002220A512|nr:uncharacterized protein BC939DRAFT_498184 [Gamsiella multidivaricata]KAI7832787.1 hypothetical protein BC939DRAFT_498184 [Gamsiella multidivaricata]
MSIEFSSTVVTDAISTNIVYSGMEEDWAIKPLMEDSEVFAEVLVQYGRSLDTLCIHCAFGDNMAVVLDMVLDKQDSAITSLRLTSRLLANVGLECMGRIIERLHNLTHLRIVANEL